MRPRTPRPVRDSNASTGESLTLALSAPFTMAAARGCSLPRSRLAASRSSFFASMPSAGSTETSFGLPSVSVPVLSTTSVSTLRISSMASAFLNSTPSVAPFPVATMMDIGVASPSAHGQAMINTATALTMACAMRGVGPHAAQTTNVSSRNAHDDRHKISRHHVGQLLDRRAAALRFADHPHDLRQQRFRADALRAHHQRARAVHGRAGDARPSLFPLESVRR